MASHLQKLIEERKKKLLESQNACNKPSSETLENEASQSKSLTNEGSKVQETVEIAQKSVSDSEKVKSIESNSITHKIEQVQIIPEKVESITYSPEFNQIRMKLAELREALLGQIPNFATSLQDIHAKLRADPAVVTLLDPPDVRLLVIGMEKHAQVEVVAPKAVKEAKSRASKTVIKADDL